MPPAPRPVYPAIEYQGYANPIERELQLLRHQVRMLDDQVRQLQRKFKRISRSRGKRAAAPIVVEFTRKLPKNQPDPPYVSFASPSSLDRFSFDRAAEKPLSSTETTISAEFPTNQNFNQSNNNDLHSDVESDDEDDDDGAEKILDAFERSYWSRFELRNQPMKVKYIPKDRSSTWPNRKTVLDPHLFT